MDATKRHKKRKGCSQDLLRLLCFFLAFLPSSSALAQEAPKTATEYFQAGLAAERVSDLQSALAAYKEAVKVEPTNPIAHYNLGITLQRVGNHKDALVALKRATELKSDYAEAYVYLGKSYEYLGQQQEFLIALQEAYRLRLTTLRFKESSAMRCEQTVDTPKRSSRCESSWMHVQRM